MSSVSHPTDSVRPPLHDALLGTRSPEEAARRGLRGGLWSVAAQALRGVVEGAAILVLTRALTPAEFGLVDMIVSATGIVDRFKDLGLSSATVQRDRLDAAQVSLLFWINCATGLLLTAIIVALSPIIALAYRRPELLDLTLALAASTFLGAIAVQHQALLRRDLRFGALAAIDTVAAIFASGIAVLLALRGAGAWSLVARQLLRLATQAALTFLVCRFRPSWPRRADIGELLRFGGDVSAAQLVNYAERNIDNALIGAYAGPRALGFYTTAYGLMRVPLDQINGFSSVVIPTLSRMLLDPARYLQAYRSIASVCLLLTVPLAPLSIYLAEWLIPALVGEQWRPSVPIFQWLALSLVAKPLMNTSGWLFLSQGRTRELRRWALWGGVIAVVSFLVGLPWGASGVAMSFALTELCVRAPLNVWLACSAGPVRARDALSSAMPAWICAAVIAVAYPLVELGAGTLTPPVRVALSGVLSTGLGLAAVLALPGSRLRLRQGRDTLRSMRGSKT